MTLGAEKFPILFSFLYEARLSGLRSLALSNALATTNGETNLFLIARSLSNRQQYLRTFRRLRQRNEELREIVPKSLPLGYLCHNSVQRLVREAPRWD